MRLGFTRVVRKKIIFGALIAAGGAAVVAVLLLASQGDAPTVAGPKSAASRAQQPGAAGAERFAALPDREAVGRPAGQPFGSPSRPPPSRAAAAAPVAAAPAAPPMPYRIAGQMVQGGAAQVVLAKGDRVLTVREGDTLEDGYRVEAIGPQGVTLLYVPMNIRETLPFASALGIDAPAARPPARSAQPPAQPSMQPGSEARPAQLRWEGPERVQAGSPFNVALKVTSDQPVRGSPLQLSYDAALLEPVEVRAGGFFSGGSFSYRINPGGSILVGAFGPGDVAADAEFLVVTFRPIRAGATAELKLSSVLLQGAAGRAIVHAQPAAFRTASQ